VGGETVDVDRPKLSPHLIPRLRLLARIWSVVVFALALMLIIAPDPNLVTPVPVTDWILLATFPGLAIVGLLLAWRWEGLGGGIALTAFIAHLIAFRFFRGLALPAPVALVQLLVFVVPGLVFILCWHLSRRRAVRTVRTLSSRWRQA
jgi:hypothetical protein